MPYSLESWPAALFPVSPVSLFAPVAAVHNTEGHQAADEWTSDPMAREEQDREDLLAEATALVERVELAVQGEAEQVVVGFRSNGCASVYFGPDPAYHFNTRDELRRAYVDGRLFKAERQRLVSLERHRTSQAVELVRHELDADETADFQRQMTRRLRGLAEALRLGHFERVGEVPAEADVAGRALGWLSTVTADAMRVASSPRVG